MNNRFKFNKEQCEYCIFNLGFCGAPGNSTQPLPCDPVDRLYESFKPKRSCTYIEPEPPLPDGFSYKKNEIKEINEKH